MSQLSRLLSILTILRSKRIVTATELAERFEVSIRTIYRDVRKLEESGVPVVTVDGKGYSLMDGYFVSPVQFTEQQANALITAQHLVHGTEDLSLVKHFNEAMLKIKSVFRASVQEKGELLERNMYVFQRSQPHLSSNVLSELQLAITNFNYTEIDYQKDGDPNITFRLVEPCALYSTDNKWIMIAWCHLRKDYRSFRVDRIRRFRMLEKKFEDRKFSLLDYYMRCRE